MKQAIDASRSTASSGLVEKMLWRQRRALFDAFSAFRKEAADGTVLNMYMYPASPFTDSDYLGAWSTPDQAVHITPHEVRLSSGTRTRTTPVRLPYADDRFDWVFCNEVIEHAGGPQRQMALIAELYRVARKGVFLTTPNRHHPIEFNSGRPLIHLLPAAWWRRMLRWSGKGEWAEEGMLNLLDAPALYRFADLLPGMPEHDVGHKRIFGIKAHFFLMIRKRA